MTAVMPISSGSPAATSVPNVMVRMISVIGRESSPAFLRSSVIVALIALAPLAPPDCSTTRSGCLDCTAAVAARLGSTRSLASVESPAISKFTRAACPSAETSPPRGQRRLDVLDVLQLREAPRHVLDRGSELRVLDGELVALDEHDLLDRPHAGAVERLLGAVRLTRELIDVGDLRRAGRVAEGEDDEDEAEPAPDRLLAVPAAPRGDAGRVMVRVLRRGGGHAGLRALAFSARPLWIEHHAPAEGRSRRNVARRGLRRSDDRTIHPGGEATQDAA